MKRPFGTAIDAMQPKSRSAQRGQGQSQSQWMDAEPQLPLTPGENPGTLTDEDSLWTDGPDAVDAAAPMGSDTRRDQARDTPPSEADAEDSQKL